MQFAIRLVTIETVDIIVNAGIIRLGVINEMIRIKDVASKYHVSRTTINNWMKLGLPFQRINKIVLFDEQKVSDWVNNNAKN